MMTLIIRKFQRLLLLLWEKNVYIERHRSTCSISFKNVKILIFFNQSGKTIAPKLGDYDSKNRCIIYKKTTFREKSY